MLCEMVSERALFAGAVNTLKRTEAGWYGDNTDGEGLARDLARLGYAVEGQRGLILGRGGAVRGLLVTSLEPQPAELTVSNSNPRSPEKQAAQIKDCGMVQPRTPSTQEGGLTIATH